MRKEFLYKTRQVIIESISSAESSERSFQVWLDGRLLKEVTFISVEAAEDTIMQVIDANNLLQSYIR
jgi:hypothetical protein